MVAEYGAELLEAGLDGLAGDVVLDTHQRLVAFEVGDDRAGSHVRVVAQDGAVHIVAVWHPRLVEQHHALELDGVAHHSVLADDGRAARERAGANLRPMVDDERPV